MADKSDKHHRRVTAYLRSFKGRILCTWSALATLADWKEKYRDLPMDLADASLIWVAQLTGVIEILTIDRKDFSVYRLPNGKALHLVL